MQQVTVDLGTGDAINRETADLNLSQEVSREAMAAKDALSNQEDNLNVNNMMAKIEEENAEKQRQIEEQRKALKDKIANCTSDTDKQSMLKKLDEYEATLKAQLKSDADA